MPLSFKTINHGEIPIGFFNIDSDMFLINNYFIFASELCQAITVWANGKDNCTTELEMYIIESQDEIGNLMGAINGLVFTGFIGELYKLYPFPKRPEDFKQKPEGYKTQKQVEELIKKFGKKEQIKIEISKSEETISIGEYKFNPRQFHEVIAYIWRGGMPMWRDGERPEYVNEMMKAIMSSTHWLFKVPMEKKK
jgi:hypothetical protein